MIQLINRITLLIVLTGCSFLSLAVNEEDSIAFEFMGMTVAHKQYNTQVIWKVQGEKEGFTYVIEKAIQEDQWTEKTRIASEEADSIIHEYNQAISDRIEAPVEHYRLIRIVDGKQEVMDTETIYHKVLSDMRIDAPPGQANKSVMIEFKSLVDVPVKLTVEDISGDILYETELDALKGENWHTLKLKKFKPGRYLVVVRDQHENKVQKALKVY